MSDEKIQQPNEEEDVEGHKFSKITDAESRFSKVSADRSDDEDTEGHRFSKVTENKFSKISDAAERSPDEDDDTEGHSFTTPKVTANKLTNQ